VKGFQTKPTMHTAALSALALGQSCTAMRHGAAAHVAVRGARPICQAPRPMPPYLIEMREELASGEAQLFDVREPGEYASGGLSQAVLVPLSELQEGIAPRQDKTKLT